MKREELKYFYATDGEVGTMPLLTNCFVYPKEDVDHLLDEKDAEIAELKAKLEDAKASHYAEMVDAGMRERSLRRALWLSRAERAHLKVLEYWPDYCHNAHCRIAEQKWDKVERKCRAMAEKFKG
jgi:hypothetical protein